MDKRILVLFGVSFLSMCLIIFAFSDTKGSSDPYINYDSSFIRIGNELLEIVLSRANGGIESIIDKRSGVDLRSQKAGTRQLIWGLSLITADNVKAWVDNPRTDSFAFSQGSAGDAVWVDLIWQGLRPDVAPRDASASVRTRITVSRGDALSRWNIGVENLSSAGVVEIRCPYISGVGSLGQSGDDDRLCVPDEEGRIFLNPSNQLSWWGQTYPSGFLNMQFLAYYDAMAGFYFAALDTKGQTKSFYWDNQNSTTGAANMGINHIFPESLSAAVDVPYDIVVGSFNGDWQSAADIYNLFSTVGK